MFLHIKWLFPNGRCWIGHCKCNPHYRHDYWCCHNGWTDQSKWEYYQLQWGKYPGGKMMSSLNSNWKLKECSKLGKQYMLETSNSFDAAIVTAMCITAVLNKENDIFQGKSFKGAIFTHIIKTGETKVIPISPGGTLDQNYDKGIGQALRKTFDIGNLRDKSEKETYRKGRGSFMVFCGGNLQNFFWPIKVRIQ